MHATIRYSAISRLGAAVAAIWLCATGPASAGDGGGDFGSLLQYLRDTVCPMFNLSPSLCPQPPTVTQGVLEVAALANNLPEMIRVQFNVEPGATVTAGNPARTTTPSTVSDLLSILTPLAFISQNPQTSTTANATRLSDSNADAYLYAVAVGNDHGTGQPDTAYFLYDDLFRTNTNGQIVAKFLFPLTVLNSTGTEREVSTQLNFTANAGRDCAMSGSTVVGNFNGNAMGTTQTLTPDQIGIGCEVVFSASPASTQTHAIFQVTVPLLVNSCTPIPTCTSINLPYFWSNQSGSPSNPLNGVVSTAFFNTTPLNPNNSTDSSGQPILGGLGKRIGLAPSAGPLGPTQTNIFALCASLPVNTNGTGAQLRPAVGAYYAVETSGEMLLSAELPSGVPPHPTKFCPPL